MIKVSGLKKAFNNIEVLKDINFEVNDGETVAIIGPSGSGKSTLLRCLNYLEKPDAGLISIGGVTAETKKVKKSTINRLRMETAMVFQHYNLFKNKTALDNITYPLAASKKAGSEEAVKIGERLLRQVGILDKAKHYPVSLSGGQQQRVGIARALAVDPHALLFDEPTSSLDPEWVGEVLKVISDISKNDKTMIIVTHEMDFAREIADRVIFMADGNIVEEGHPGEVFDDPQNERTRKFLKNYTTQQTVGSQEENEPELLTV
ncbi:amino acid ABC transporter ATP-binding protein [Salinicoccus sediminis]|uniref:Amino acid ABC transporter ATP-binding protein n=1 Tax=Salinicoccus sediminis TaxID=1432562 RepID=A0A0M2SFI6_9STAP|nr:amino acid ABC transporter ATP-binding protein [Salinicoccus sediminis]KKK33499.1 amino acid ABC transporter ATP-binding protein [Salinicoccus sediminis]